MKPPASTGDTNLRHASTGLNNAKCILLVMGLTCAHRAGHSSKFPSTCATCAAEATCFEGRNRSVCVYFVMAMAVMAMAAMLMHFASSQAFFSKALERSELFLLRQPILKVSFVKVTIQGPSLSISLLAGDLSPWRFPIAQKTSRDNPSG